MNLSKTTAYLITLTTAVVLCKSCCLISAECGTFRSDNATVTKIAKNETIYTYKLTGFSALTGERVLAYLNQREDDPSRLEGIVHDQYHTYHINAIWNGKGTALARSIISTYQLEVIK